MESLYLLISALFILLLSSFMFYKNRPKFTGPNLPPGSFGWPVLGESYEFLSTGWKGYPEKFIFDRIRKFSSNIFKTSLFMEPVAVFAGAECHKFLFSNENKLVVVWWPESVKKLFPTAGRNTYTEEGLKVRKLVITQFLKQEGLQKYIGIMDSIAQRHFSMGWEKEETVFVSQLTKMYTFWLACRFFLSIEDPVRVAKLEAPFKLVTRGIMSIPINFPGTSFSKAIKASNFIREELMAIIKLRKVDLAENRVSSNQDLLSHVLLATDETGKHKTEMYIADHILGLLVAGHDTVSVTCTFIVKYLAELPDVYDKVYKEQMEIARSKSGGELLKWNDIQKMKYSWNVACEVMRLAPPLQGTFREAITDFVYKGFSIPKGLKLYWSAHSTHRNPECFPEPEKFDPTRFEGKGPAPYTYVPFGGGPRMCPGTEYARVVILVFMHNLVRRFKFEKVIADEKIIVDPTPAPTKGLPVRLFPHQHNA